MSDPIVMFDSNEAASRQTLTGWVSRSGLFYGDGESAERAARYDGCTHRPCETCGDPAQKSWLVCDSCREKNSVAHHAARETVEWDGESMLYSETCDQYYSGPDEAEDQLDEGQTLAYLRLVVCEKQYVRELDADFCHDLLPDDDELPQDVIDAMDVFNEAVKGTVLSWTPGCLALRIGIGE